MTLGSVRHGQRSATDAPPKQDRPDAATPARSRALTVLSVLAVALFALWGIGGPLLGRSVLGATDEMTMQGPYRNGGWADERTTNTFLDDTYTSQFPDLILFHDSVARGEPAGWNPYGAGGSPLASVPNGALLSPLTIPYFVLPTWLAPGYEKLLEIICSVGACFLFLRRLRVSRPAAIAGGLVFASSAFMVVWLNFPQTQVAAFIPAVFWTVERFIQKARVRDAALISVPVAAMLLGGFPAVAGYTFVTVAAYALVRVLAQHRGEPRRALARLVGIGLGLCAGIGMAMFQLLAFLGFYRTWLIEGRGQQATDHLDPVSLVTAVAPWALGTTDPSHLPRFFLAANLPESMAYVGAAALVLALIALALPRHGRAALPRGAWIFLVAATAVWAELIYLGGPPLALLQQLPGLRELFGGNFIGRSRSILGFLLAVLAAVGFDLLLRRRDPLQAVARHRAPAISRPGPRHAWSGPAWLRRRRSSQGRLRRPWSSPVSLRRAWSSQVWLRRLWPLGLATGVLVAGAWLVAAGRRDAIAAGIDYTLGRRSAVVGYDRQILLAAGLVLLALACAVVLWHSAARSAKVWRVARFAAAAGLPLLIAVQGLYFVTRYYPDSARDTFYPVTDTHRYLAENLGEQRFAASAAGMVKGTTTAYRLRSVNGHAFINEAFAELVRGMPGEPIAYPTHLDFAADLGQATSPILDRLGTKYFVTSPQDPLFGVAARTGSDGTALELRPDQPVTVSTPVSGRLRGLGFIPLDVPAALAAPRSTNWVDVLVRDASGATVAQARRLTAFMTRGTDFLVPVALDNRSDDAALTVTLTLHGSEPLRVAGTGGEIALSTVAGADDGLRLVYAGSTVIYERLAALRRIRWASRAVVEPDPDARVRMLASGSLDRDTVVLSAPGPVAGNGPAKLQVQTDGTDVIITKVEAAASGYLVVADADQVGWSATIDGAPADLVAADQGVVAVPLPAGAHTVTLRFAAPSATAGGWIAAGTAAVVLLMVAAEWWRGRRRGAGRPEQVLGPVQLSQRAAR